MRLIIIIFSISMLFTCFPKVYGSSNLDERVQLGAPNVESLDEKSRKIVAKIKQAGLVLYPARFYTSLNNEEGKND